ncbi:MAG: tryptophan/tyrosine permease, partial [Gammaproteobacteria bacterium]|nr:tryptophan/tyrosine permease [Gammaproteobacteria bacterium]
MEKIAQNLGSPKRASLSKCIGGLLLIVGTTIGGGMLALPVVSGNSGFIGSSFSLLGIWFLMTVGALFITEVNLRFPVGTHFISMARKSIGSFGALLTWALYISLLYSLIAAYCSAGTDLIQTLFAFRGIHLPSSGALLIFMLIFGGVVVLGLRSVDFINRGIMLLKILTYLFMIVVAFRYIHPQSLWQPAAMPDQSSIMSMVTAFGFAI